ncbi:kinase-like domain-containing protein [Cladochytrium replicatum]|nr:kinase-like domain-containing protein [Cladochytrium replicatum]
MRATEPANPQGQHAMLQRSSQTDLSRSSASLSESPRSLPTSHQPAVTLASLFPFLTSKRRQAENSQSSQKTPPCGGRTISANSNTENGPESFAKSAPAVPPVRHEVEAKQTESYDTAVESKVASPPPSIIVDPHEENQPTSLPQDILKLNRALHLSHSPSTSQSAATVIPPHRVQSYPIMPATVAPRRTPSYPGMPIDPSNASSPRHAHHSATSPIRIRHSTSRRNSMIATSPSRVTFTVGPGPSSPKMMRSPSATSPFMSGPLSPGGGSPGCCSLTCRFFLMAIADRTNPDAIVYGEYAKGDQIGRYVIDRLIGSGAFSKVYSAAVLTESQLALSLRMTGIQYPDDSTDSLNLRSGEETPLDQTWASSTSDIFRPVTLESNERVAVKIVRKDFLDNIGSGPSGDPSTGGSEGLGIMAGSTVSFTFPPATPTPSMATASESVRRGVSGERVWRILGHECAIWRTLDHPNIARMIEVMDLPDVVMIVSELCEGGSLFSLLSEATDNPMSLKQASKIFAQIVEGVKYMHENGVVHRDLKLENVLLKWAGGEAVAKLGDFGLSARVAELDELVGLDSSPQQQQQQQNLDMTYGSVLEVEDEDTDIFAGSLHYSDVWALGCVLHAIITGGLPFEDEYFPRLQMSILKGRWDVEGLIAAAKNALGADAAGGVRNVDELLKGCLEVDAAKRWDIEKVE